MSPADVAKHTPGPWNEVPGPYVTVPDKAWEIVGDSTHIAWVESEQARADARLIAAAPDLLEAVLAARRFCYGRPEADGLALALDGALNVVGWEGEP